MIGNDSPIELGLTADRSVEPASPAQVPHVEHRSTWMHRVLATFGATDPHVPDEDVFAILNVESDRESAGEVCAAQGITLGMYCVWKRKYARLDLENVRAARRKELWRARGILAMVVGAAVGVTAGLLVGLSSLGPAQETNDVQAVLPSTPSRVHAAPFVTAPDAASLNGTTAAPPAEPVARPGESIAPAPASPLEPGYKVQVAAAPTLDEATALIQKLTAAGHSAYLSRAIVRDVEVFRVRVGPLDTLAAAQEVTARLKGAGFAGTWIAVP